MERRNRSLKALEELKYIDSLDDQQRAKQLLVWSNSYMTESIVESFDLSLANLKELAELFYKNINFLKSYREEIKIQLDNKDKIKSFFK
jgi:hypothetical protein